MKKEILFFLQKFPLSVVFEMFRNYFDRVREMIEYNFISRFTQLSVRILPFEVLSNFLASYSVDKST